VSSTPAAQPGLITGRDIAGLARADFATVLPPLLARSTQAARGQPEARTFAGACGSLALVPDEWLRPAIGTRVIRRMKALEQFDIGGRSALVTGGFRHRPPPMPRRWPRRAHALTLTDVDGTGARREAAAARRRCRGARAGARRHRPRAQRAVFDSHVAAFGGLDICFANAGVGIGSGSEPGRVSQRRWPGGYDGSDFWDRTIAINLTGAYNTMREAVRAMKARQAGLDHRDHLQRGADQRGHCGMPYMPAKAGLAHLVRHLAMELAEFRIRVNAIAPALRHQHRRRLGARPGGARRLGQVRAARSHGRDLADRRWRCISPRMPPPS
jgi:NAD(P)-dependent dehydrogenase (short-subunit alcohol dehydrogenase family)